MSAGSSLNSFSALGAMTQASTAAAAPPAAGRGAKAAEEFEAQLIGSLVASMEKTFAALPGDDRVAGADNYNYLGAQALAKVLAEHGGFGIAALIRRHLPAETPESAAKAEKGG